MSGSSSSAGDRLFCRFLYMLLLSAMPAAPAFCLPCLPLERQRVKASVYVNDVKYM